MADTVHIKAHGEVARRTAVLYAWHAAHQRAEPECRRRLRLWRDDYEQALRRSYALQRTNVSRSQRPVTLHDPAVFFWAVRESWDDAFADIDTNVRNGLFRLATIRNDAAHGVPIAADRVIDAFEAANRFLSSIGIPALDIPGGAQPQAHGDASALAPWPPAVIKPPPGRPVVAPSVDDTDPDGRSAGDTSTPVDVGGQSDVLTVTDDGAPPDEPVLADRWLPTVLPIYLVCDASDSMIGEGIAEVNAGLGEFVAAIAAQPVAADACRVAIIEFATRARVVRPLGRVDDGVPIDPVVANGLTNYGRAFDLLRQSTADDLARLSMTCQVLRPVIFMFTDGDPSDSGWFASYEQLVDPGAELAPTVVFIPVSDVADITLDRLRTSASGHHLEILDNRDARAIGAAVRSAIRRVTASVLLTVQNPTHELVLADGEAA